MSLGQDLAFLQKKIPPIQHYPYNKIQETSENSYGSFLGIGVFFKYDTKNISFQLFPSIGVNFHQYYSTSFYGESRGDMERDLYYRFNLIEKIADFLKTK